MIHINAYLNFNGQCREAMIFYKECLGGELTMQKVAESPMAAQLPSRMAAHILHSSLEKDGMLLMASDMMGSGLIPGNGIGLCINCNNEEEMTVFFDNLSRGGRVKHPLHQTFWGGTYGELTDKFGINWIFNCVKN